MYVEIVERARRAGLAGATVTAGLSEPGPVGRAQERNAASLLGDVPVEVTIIESPERLDGFLSQSGDLLEGVLVARNPVRVVRQRDRSSGGSRP